jgi:iron complex outermembrane receptor protein
MPINRSPASLGSLTVLSMSLAAIWHPAHAQSAANAAAAAKKETGIETVVVTAQKRSQSIKEVPVAITVVNAAQLEKAGVKDIGDLAKTAAALEFGDQNSTSGPGGSASIRGIGTAVMTISAESSVGVVVDGVPLGATASGLMLDMARVEVLRGPQGTLFGKNASAGVLNMATQAPLIGDSGGNVQFEYKGTYGAVLRATANLPINDISALRASGIVERNEGVLRNVHTGKDSVTDNGGLRLRYLLKPNSDVAVNLIGEASNTRSENAVFFAPAVASASNAAGHQPLAEFAACGVTVSKTNNQVCSDGPEHTRAKVRGLSGQVDWTLGSGSTLTSITAYRTRQVGPNYASIDMSEGYDKIRNLIPDQNAKQFSQELRIASPARQPIEYVAGLFYADSKNDKRTITTILPNPVLPSPPVPRSIATDTMEHANMTTAAMFGQTTFRLSEATSLITGLRYTRDKVSSDYNEGSVVSFSGFSLPAAVKTAAAAQRKPMSPASSACSTRFRATPMCTPRSAGATRVRRSTTNRRSAPPPSPAPTAASWSSRNCRPASRSAPSCPS